MNMNKINKKIAITTGDVNGIGAEITLKALNKLNLPKENVILISNSDVLKFYNDRSGLPAQQYQVLNMDFDSQNILPGEITVESGDFSFRSLKKVCELAKDGEIGAIVTAPVAKEALHLAGHKFNGQTEILQEFLARDSQKAEMLFVAKDFRVLLLTRHIPLKQIKLDKDVIVKKITNLNEFFKTKLNIAEPNFALCSFNPHAGENGILGREEIEIISPAVEILKTHGIKITEPLPSDTLFIKGAQAYLSNNPMPYDCYVAMYHDQGLIPIKSVASDKTVNMTIGLDVIRTSPCHGTAFDIAGKNLAVENSMIEAILQALK